MRHIVSFSSGLSSAIAAKRVWERFGKENTKLIFLDVLTEDSDNYRFMQEFQEKFQVQITVLSEGMTPWQLFEKKHIIPNSRIAPCTFHLKINLFKKYLEDQRGAAIYIGYDYTELERCEPTQKSYGEMGFEVDFPLLWKPYEMRPYSQVVREDWGIEPPRMYDLGYTHANCGGCCVKQGQGDWLRTLQNFPDRYHAAEVWEERMRQKPENAKYALMKIQKNGTVFPMTLKEFRLKYEMQHLEEPKLFQPEKLDEMSPCVVCGIGAIDL